MNKLALSLLIFEVAQPVVMGRQSNRASRSRSSVTFPSGLSLPVAKSLGKNNRKHRDPNRSGNVPLVTSGKYRKMKLSKNFTVGEFAQSGGNAFDVARIDPKFVMCLQRIRDDVGKPVRINSGYRSEPYNDALYRARGQKPTRSQHISGRAADIKVGRMTGTQIAEAAIDACGTDIAIGLGRQYAHIDMRGHFRIWKYDVNNRQVAKVKRYRDANEMAQKKRARRTLTGSVSNQRVTRRVKSTSRA